MNKLKGFIKQTFLKLGDRKRLLFWMAQTATIEEIYFYNLSAGTFNVLEEQRWKALVLTNVTKSKLSISASYYRNFISHGADFQSQLGQDCLVDTILRHKTNGVYIEIGVGNGKELSNTYFFEKVRNWQGLLCEPAKQFHDPIRKGRNGILIDKAVYNKSGEVLKFSESVDNGELSGLVGFGTVDDSVESNNRSYEVTTVTFNDICNEFIPGRVIDYLSVDTEGSEFEILSSIDFTKHSISCITVEHNYDSKKIDKIRSLLEKNNFSEYAAGVFKWDAVFVNKNIPIV